jgi:hypothetical protein
MISLHATSLSHTSILVPTSTEASELFGASICIFLYSGGSSLGIGYDLWKQSAYILILELL